MDRRSRGPIGVILSAVIAVATVLGAAVPAVLASEAPTYLLPAPAGTALVVSQGNDDPAFRTDDERYAFDFVSANGPARFPVVAARGGTVISARAGNRGGRCQDPGDGQRPECWRSVNHVLIDHGDGTSGLYLHLTPGPPIVRSGDVVSRGQPIGSAGNTGWTDAIGLQFQVQRTPAWPEQGRGGWFLTESQPVAFSDTDVLAQRPDGVPQTGDTVTSANPGPTREPFQLRRRPVNLPATVPFQVDADRELRAAYEADSADGYGLHFAPLVEAGLTTSGAPADPAAATEPATGDLPAPSEPPGVPVAPMTDPGTIVRPLFGGELAFAGCATGASASLGRVVAIRLGLDDAEYLAVLGHLTEIEPSLLDLDPAGPPLIIGPNEYLGRYGTILAPDQAPALDCPEADPAADDLFAAILADASVTPEGEIVGGTPISPEPLVGALAYEGFDWWRGPVTAIAIAEEPGRPRASWNQKTPANAAHVVFGGPIRLAARVRDVTDISQVRFRAYYPAWPRAAASTALDSFRPATSWRQLAVCTPPEGRGTSAASGCRWNGSRRDAVVSFDWDPTLAPPAPTAPWLPRARPAITDASLECVPVSLAVEVVDAAGHVSSEIGRLPLPAACDERTVERSRNGRVLYLDPLVPPEPPLPKGNVEDRGWPPAYAPDPLDGAIVWKDRSDNEDGFRIYARRSWFEVDCSVTDGPWVLVKELPPDTKSYRPQHTKVVRSIDVPQIKGVPGTLVRWEYAVSAYNLAEETKKVPVGGFIGGSEAFCDPGLEPPPDL